MTRTRKLVRLSALLSFGCVVGCGGLGKVNQGRVIDYDPEKGLVTLIQDSNYKEPGKAVYDLLPPITIAVPADPKQMGPAPEAGKLMELDSQKRLVVIFDTVNHSFKSVPYTLVEQAGDVFKDDRRVKGVAFPVIDRERMRITIYSPKQRELVTFSLPDEYFNLPADTWRAGDEIRYYYKDPRHALRLMNITKTEIT